MTFTCTFRNGETRSGLSFEDSWALFVAYMRTNNPCSVSVDDRSYRAP